MNEKQASVAARISELACLPMSELWTVWDRYFPRRPDYPNRTHVESRIAYKLQEEAFGGLAPETTAIDTYLARTAAIHIKVDRLRQLADNHFGHDPEAIHWGHVGDLGRVDQALDDLLAIFDGQAK